MLLSVLYLLGVVMLFPLILGVGECISRMIDRIALPLKRRIGNHA